ncbi:dihydropteroate synthase [Candidatus Poribacteria bacterium]|nr:dihydropteroate synthase [Candidatus Poribacteria bacterium]
MNCRGKLLTFGQRTLIMGILNVTPDSFSDGGHYFEVDKAIARAKQMVEEGADIIDIGGESTRPGALSISAENELARVLPVIEGLAGETAACVSIDTSKAAVAQQALQAGAHIVNDITALKGDPNMAGVVAEMKAGVVLMHIQGTPRTMQHSPVYQDLIPEILSSLRQSIDVAEAAGIHPEQIMIDPGIGFGKTLEHTLEILRRLDEFRCLKKPILIGTSRKSFIGKILNLPVDDRVEGTAATVAWAIAHGADVIRVHDVKAMRRVAQMTDAIYRHTD